MASRKRRSRRSVRTLPFDWLDEIVGFDPPVSTDIDFCLVCGDTGLCPACYPNIDRKCQMCKGSGMCVECGRRHGR